VGWVVLTLRAVSHLRSVLSATPALHPSGQGVCAGQRVSAGGWGVGGVEGAQGRGDVCGAAPGATVGGASDAGWRVVSRKRVLMQAALHSQGTTTICCIAPGRSNTGQTPIPLHARVHHKRAAHPGLQGAGHRPGCQPAPAAADGVPGAGGKWDGSVLRHTHTPDGG